VIGGDESHQVAAARKTGEEIARADQIILTGGRPEPGNEVKNATLWGAHEAERSSTADNPVKARMVGILKGGKLNWKMPNPCRLVVETGLSSFERDPINGLTPDAIIVFRGGRGTLCELAYAAAASKPIAFYDSIVQLRQKTHEHLSDGVLVKVLEEALGRYPNVSGKRVSSEDLITALNHVLKTAQPTNPDPKQLVSELIRRVFAQGTMLPRTGFPGLDGDAEQFEIAVKRMDDCA
jgi:predicted Rossmann-fold nucleotide-binding protein